MASSVSNRKKQKELEQKRQTGELPPQTDEETGKMINPHNPEYITKRPWYLGESGPSLKHHSIQKAEQIVSINKMDKVIQQAKTKSSATVKFLPGACKNCGSKTHSERECVERPRASKTKAATVGFAVVNDGGLLNLEEFGKLTYDSKRDRWAGYHPDEHQVTIYRYNTLENERKKKRKEQRDKEVLQKLKKKEKKVPASDDSDSDGDDEHEKTTDSDSDSDSDSDYDSDEEDDNDDDNKDFLFKDCDQKDFQKRVARQGGLNGSEMKTTVRNLRIREHTAKYLRNLDPNSAFYDPKTRAMRDNPMPNENPENVPFAGDNFVRQTGDVSKVVEMDLFCWESSQRGQNLQLQANPTQAEFGYKNFQERNKKLQEEQKSSVLNVYGGAEHLKKPDERLILGQTENYIEYSIDGRVSKGAPKATVKTKYEEDVLINNHTSVWGSFFDPQLMQWGYACCHSTIKNSFCTGEKGIEVNKLATEKILQTLEDNREMLPFKNKGALPIQSKESLFGLPENSQKFDYDSEKLERAIKELDENQKISLVETDDRKRKYNSMTSFNNVSTEEMEAYRLKKIKAEDPMNLFEGIDNLLEIDDVRLQKGN